MCTTSKSEVRTLKVCKLSFINKSDVHIHGLLPDFVNRDSAAKSVSCDPDKITQMPGIKILVLLIPKAEEVIGAPTPHCTMYG